jgi:hypothetical protein
MIDPSKENLTNRSEKVMTNGEAIGYMILAGKALRIDPRIIKQFETEMKYQMGRRNLL